MEVYEYKGETYPEYLKKGNAIENILPIAKKFCRGKGLDIGGTPEWNFPGAEIVNPEFFGNSASHFSDFELDFIFSSHCLEHLPDYIEALLIWKESLKINGQLFLYLPHPDMKYWRPENCRKHRHQFTPEQMKEVLLELGFFNIFYSERDLYWSFAITGKNGG